MKKTDDYALNLLNKMVEIFSPSGEESVLADFLLSEMKLLGFHSWKDAVGNVLGEIGSGRPVVLLCGHMDTVPERLSVRIENDKLYGRGTVDAKSSLASMIIASSFFVKEKFLGKILIAGVVDEEGLSRGVKHFLKENSVIDYAIFGEPSGIENITIAYKGSLHLRITCETQTGHSAAPWLFDNAIEKTYEILTLIKNYHMIPKKLQSRFYSLTSCITRINGGGAFSLVPSWCESHINVRIPPLLTGKAVLKGISEIIDKYLNENPKINVILKVEDMNEAYEADKNSTLVKSLSFAVRKIRNKQPTLLKKTGTGDMNLLGNATKIPVVTYGPGNSSLDHTLDEYIDIQEYRDSIKVLRLGLKRLFYLEARGKSAN